jgi:hypothetical protein
MHAPSVLMMSQPNCAADCLAESCRAEQSCGVVPHASRFEWLCLASMPLASPGQRVQHMLLPSLPSRHLLEHGREHQCRQASHTWVDAPACYRSSSQSRCASEQTSFAGMRTQKCLMSVLAFPSTPSLCVRAETCKYDSCPIIFCRIPL